MTFGGVKFWLILCPLHGHSFSWKECQLSSTGTGNVERKASHFRKAQETLYR
jgi:hypothetical protein